MDTTAMNTDALNRLLIANLQSLMAEKGLNPSAWAKDSGFSHTAVRDIINGKVKNPTYRVLVALAETAKVDVRRITVGPDYQEVDQQTAEIADLISRLEPDERRLLLNLAKSQIADRADSQE